MAKRPRRMAWRYGAALVGLLALVLRLAPAADERPAVSDTVRVGEPIAPVPAADSLDPRKIRLGERLFHDPQLSHGNQVSCASCHRLDEGGDDDRAVGMGTNRQRLDFNAPTIFNVALNFRLNWRGNFRTLEEQNAAALVDPRLMNNRWVALLATLQADGAYRRAFAGIYGGTIGRAQVLDALATYQRSLVTPDARFDRYLRGERGAITPEEEHGYLLFKAYGCIACHQGVNVGGNLFQKFGIFADPFTTGPLSKADLGRFTITGDPADRHVFRVPSLRNVALTAPYFHDGSTASLEEAVAIMARNQLGRTLASHETDLIARFLNTLTGEFRGRSVAAAPSGNR